MRRRAFKRGKFMGPNWGGANLPDGNSRTKLSATKNRSRPDAVDPKATLRLTSPLELLTRF